MPMVPRSQLKAQHGTMEEWFPDTERKRQIQRSLDDNEDYGRDLIVATCWYIDERESREMWEHYGKDHEAIAIKSTVTYLADSLVKALPNKWWIGKVRYVDSTTYGAMDAYEASQACQRAFLKGTRYANEKELRVATMNFVAHGCLNPDGSPPTPQQRRGYIDASDGPGVYVTANLKTMIKEVRTAPQASGNHHKKVECLTRNAGYHIPILRSSFAPP